MKRVPFLMLIALILSACSKQETQTYKTPAINGLDLTKIQSVDYFRANLAAAKELSAWCVQHVNPADNSSNEIAIINLKNCKNSEFALRMPVVDITAGKKYKQY